MIGMSTLVAAGEDRLGGTLRQPQRVALGGSHHHRNELALVVERAEPKPLIGRRTVRARAERNGGRSRPQRGVEGVPPTGPSVANQPRWRTIRAIRTRRGAARRAPVATSYGHRLSPPDEYSMLAACINTTAHRVDQRETWTRIRQVYVVDVWSIEPRVIQIALSTTIRLTTPRIERKVK
jgi:hypothetical protein